MNSSQMGKGGARAGFFFAERNALVVVADPDAGGDLRREIRYTRRR
jgi:hypothetical protein